jgi:hypothetical protein
MDALTHTLQHLGLLQHLSALLFLLSYSAALGSMLSPTARLRAVGVALLAAGCFALATRPWEHGVLLVLGAVGGMGLFIAATWALGRMQALHPSKPLLSIDSRWAATPDASSVAPAPAVGVTALHGVGPSPSPHNRQVHSG